MGEGTLFMPTSPARFQPREGHGMADFSDVRRGAQLQGGSAVLVSASRMLALPETGPSADDYGARLFLGEAQVSSESVSAVLSSLHGFLSTGVT